ncbi:MAG: PLP-dependent transferase [Planctomycetaceae bacterium]|nr:PLP-dependent transferase [Planctomycetaceae bacterium]
MKFRTRAIHVGNERDPETGAVVPPIHVASTYVQPGAGEWGEFDYGRSGNPTRHRAEQTLASLESGDHALLFASGMAAIHAATILLKAGDHIVAGTDIYGGTYRLLHKIASRAGITVSLANSQDPQSLEKAFHERTRLLWLESPGNPLMSITDLENCCAIAHQRDILVAVDNTFATPVLTRPLEFGVDIVMHSATKYLGGHSDLIGGALVVRDQKLFDELYYIQNATGAVLSPFDAFLLARGMKTLALRVKAHSESAATIAQFLQADPRVKRVLYPGLEDHPGHLIAKRQMQGGFGGMLSFEIDGDFTRTKAFVESTQLFQLAVSLGAVESLIEQPASMSHASYDPADRAAHGIVDSLVRLSIGLEDVDDLQQDISQALSACN